MLTEKQVLAQQVHQLLQKDTALEVLERIREACSRYGVKTNALDARIASLKSEGEHLERLVSQGMKVGSIVHLLAYPDDDLEVTEIDCGKLQVRHVNPPRRRVNVNPLNIKFATPT